MGKMENLDEKSLTEHIKYFLHREKKHQSIADGCTLSYKSETRMVRKDGSTRIDNFFPSAGLDLNNLLKIIPMACCPLKVRFFLWHYLAKPIINSSWLLFVISIFGF